MRHPGSVLRHTPPVRSAMRAGSRYKPAAVPVRTSCEPEPCSALPMQPGEGWSCLDRYQWMRCACDDPPDVNCRAKSTRRRTISLIALALIDPQKGEGKAQACVNAWFR